MIWKQQQAYSEHRAQRILSGNAKANEHRSNMHSPRSISSIVIQDSQSYHKDTYIGLQKISKEIVESLTKALTPNCKVRQNSPPLIMQEQEAKQQIKLSSHHENIRQPLESISNTKQNKDIETVGYINFTKFARKISQQPIKDIKVIRTGQKMSRQKSEDFHSKQEQWLKQKNEKVLKQRIEKQCQECRQEYKMNLFEKSQTDRFQ